MKWSWRQFLDSLLLICWDRRPRYINWLKCNSDSRTEVYCNLCWFKRGFRGQQHNTSTQYPATSETILFDDLKMEPMVGESASMELRACDYHLQISSPLLHHNHIIVAYNNIFFIFNCHGFTDLRQAFHPQCYKLVTDLIPHQKRTCTV